MIYPRQLLIGLLALQLLVLAGVLYWGAGDTEESTQTLLTVSADTVDRVQISEGDASVTLHRTDAGWLVGETADVPADGDKLTEVLNDLVELRLGWPVATSVDTQSRFEVAADNYQRHVEVFVEDAKVGDFYLGSSPGYRRVHARRAESDDIFSVDFATFELPVDVAGWLDKSLLAVSGEISQIERPGQWLLRKASGVLETVVPPGDDPSEPSAEQLVADALAGADSEAVADTASWTLRDVAGARSLDASQTAAADLAERLRNLRITGVASAAAVGEPATVLITRGGETSELSLWHDAEQDEYVIASSAVAGQFTVASYVAEQLLLAVDDLAEAAPDA